MPMDASRVPFEMPMLDVYKSIASREPRSCNTHWEGDVSGGGRDRTYEAAGSHTNFKVDRGRARTATTIQLSRRRAGGHTPSEMYRVGALDAETNQ